MEYEEIIDYINLDEPKQLQELLSVPSHNGPYYDEETEVRLLSHYIILYCKYSKMKGASHFDKLIKEMADELCNPKFRPGGYTFLFRKGNRKDKTNGVIGQAWVLEALTELYLYFGDTQYIDLAKKLFLMHPYDEKLGAWHCVSVEGKILPCDMTFNHQLWFAAAGSIVNAAVRTAEIEECLLEFMNNINNIFRIHKNGLIVHKLFPYERSRKAKFYLGQFREYLLKTINKPNMEYKEIGYHSFNLYAFALLRDYFVDHPFFRSKHFIKAMQYCNTKEYFIGLQNRNHNKDINSEKMPVCYTKCNRYGYVYNVSGFEMVYVFKIFGKGACLNKDVVNKLFKEQIKYTYDKGLGMFVNTEDNAVVNARKYELMRVFVR